MNCPVCMIEISSQDALRSHLTFDHTHQQLQEVAEYGKSLPLSSFHHMERKFGFSSEAQELFSQLHNARQLHNQNLLAQRKALSTLSKTLEPGLSVSGKVGIQGIPMGEKVKAIGESSFQLFNGSQQHKVSNVIPCGAASSECLRHQSEIRRLEASLLEKKKEIADLVLQLKKEMEELENKDMIITDLNKFLQETAEKQSVARAKLEAYMDSLLTRTAKAEGELQSIRSLSPSFSQKQLRRKSSGPSDEDLMGDGLVRTYSVPADIRKDSKLRERLKTANRKITLAGKDTDKSLASQLRRSLQIVRSPSVELERVLDQLKTKRSSSVRSTLSTSKQNLWKEPLSRGRLRGVNQSREWRDLGASSASGKSPFHKASYQENTEAEITPHLYPDTMQPSRQNNSSTHTRLKNHSWTYNSPRLSPSQQRVQNELLQADIERSLYRRQLQGRMDEEKTLKILESRDQHLGLVSMGTVGSLGETDSTESLSVSSLSEFSIRSEKWSSSENQNMNAFPLVHRRVVLLCIMKYLDIDSLLNCALVCREWKRVSRHPSLWTCLHFVNRRVSSKFFETISSWCTELQVLKLSRLKSSSRRMTNESKEAYQRRVSGCLDEGLESLLCSSQGNVMVIKIVDCPHIFTKRSLLLIGRYCPNVRSLKVSSASFSINKEIIKCLGEGCPNITSLQILPGSHARGMTQTFSNNCLSMIGQSWYQLQALSIGGKAFSKSGLIAVAQSCQQLQVLELSKALKVEEGTAKQMGRVGLKELHTLFFTHTVVTPQAIVQFHALCPHLKSVRVYLSAANIFPSRKKDSHPTVKFDDVISKLEKLKEHQGLRDVVQVWVSNQ